MKMKIEEDDIYVFYVKNVKTGKPAIVKTFFSYEEAEKYWGYTIFPHGLPVWGVHFHFHFDANKETDDLDITKEVIFGKAKTELR